MSSIEVENMNQNANIGNGKKKLQMFRASSSVPVERRTLQTIQLSAESRGLTRPGEQHKAKDGKDKGKAKIFASNKPLAVFEDPKPASENVSSRDSRTTACDQTDTTTDSCTCLCHGKSEEDQMYDFMTAEPSLQEWKDLAEERRQALDESLVENRQLHFEISEYKTHVSSLAEEVRDLQQESRRLSQQRDYFASILEKLVDEEETTSDTPDSAVSESAFVTDSSDSS